MTTPDSIKKDRGGQVERFSYVETRIYWTGQFKRRYLAERFGTSPAQQSKDMVLYQELAPGNLEYDKKTWVYRILPTFKPVFTNPTPDSLLGLILSDKESLGLQAEVALLPRPTRSAPPEIVREILLAVQFGQSLHIRYQSMTKHGPEDRWITPHALAHDGCRFHARALCHASGLYKDFVLGRILGILGHGEAMGDPLADHDWNEIVQLHLGPHPGLLDGPRKVIENDYGMRDGKVAWNVRKAMLPYVVAAQHLLLEHDRPDYQQIILLNKKELIDSNVLQHNI
jgi:predicted DNA-binding transcriptional regulator YafY